MKILGLRTCIYKIADLQKAIEWYSEIFGIKPYFNEPFYVGFNIAGYELGLLPEEGNDNAKGENIMTYWGVEDINKAYEKFLKAGATEYEKPADVGEGIFVAAVKDPWQNIVGLIYNPNFKPE